MAITISGSGITSANIADGTIVSGDIASGTIASSNIADGTIVNADINSSAAIAGTKVSGSFGKVLQVVSSTHSTDTSTSSTNFVTTGHSVTLTPAATSSKVLVMLAGGGGYVDAGSWLKMVVYRGATKISSGEGFTAYSGSGSNNVSHSMMVLDSPSTTSATTYTIYFKTNTGTPQYRWSDKGDPVLTAMEIGA